MSEATNVLQTSNELFTNYSYEKVFIGFNTFESATMTNASGGDLTYPIGTLLGRIGASQKVVPLASAAVDGSQFPVGVLAETVTIANGADATISMGVSGEVDKDLITLDGTDTMTTLVSLKSIADRIASDTLGIKLITATEMSKTDNA